jgi:hypothetical protein
MIKNLDIRSPDICNISYDRTKYAVRFCFVLCNIFLLRLQFHFMDVFLIYSLKIIEGVQVEMWVNLVQARMFFNYLCDEHNTIIGHWIQINHPFSCESTKKCVC